jgi:hypothetical protein
MMLIWASFADLDSLSILSLTLCSGVILAITWPTNSTISSRVEFINLQTSILKSRDSSCLVIFPSVVLNYLRREFIFIMKTNTLVLPHRDGTSGSTFVVARSFPFLIIGLVFKSAPARNSRRGQDPVLCGGFLWCTRIPRSPSQVVTYFKVADCLTCSKSDLLSSKNESKSSCTLVSVNWCSFEPLSLI